MTTKPSKCSIMTTSSGLFPYGGYVFFPLLRTNNALFLLRQFGLAFIKPFHVTEKACLKQTEG